MANSSSRNGAKVLWVTVHTAEGIRKASDLKAFFERSTNSSSHAVADDSTLLDNLVPYDRAAWTLRNGNTRSDNLELCGFAAWSRAEWLNNHQGMLSAAATWIRSRCTARGIPIVKLSPADVRAGKSGVIGHVDYTNGTGDGTHWDPGPGFPWDVVMARAGAAPSGGGAASPGTPSPTPTSEDDLMISVPPGTNQHVELIVKGKTKLYLACAFAQKVTVNAVLFYGDTGNDLNGTGVGGGFDGMFRTPPEKWSWDPNRPGPIDIPANAAMVTVVYDAAHSFALGAV